MSGNKTPHPATFSRQKNTLFGNTPATTSQIWQHDGNNTPILATAR
jgi:hypothetical protein